ncbi:MAG: 4a-hydroxytetrahydrobiopterin dehydratase [Beijerinckiaceae bacterium]|nr:4a-hydroxytetrahydrobiopterin dehydratase [Beijerinckiaceae bacterium]
MTGLQTIEAGEIARRLSQDLPHWRVEGQSIKRLYKVNGFKSAMLAANAIGHMAEAAWHHPDLSISWGKVEVSLWSHDAGGVTERDMALARRIEDFIAWRPPAGGPLEGTPSEAQFAYVLPD